MTNGPDRITEWIDKEIKRHRLWRQIWSLCYFSTAALTIVSGSVTTAVAGLGDARYAAWLAAATTVLAGL